MRITELAIRNLGRHRDASFPLAAGLTVVRGPNEAGKSTIQRAIELALTRPATSIDADLAAIRSWGGTEGGTPWVALGLSWDDEDGSVHAGRLEKSFAGEAGTVRLEIDGQAITDPARAEAALADLSGVPSEGFFRSTASVRHHELTGLGRNETALRERLAASISGADRSSARARHELETALADLRPKSGGSGRLAVAADAVADAERRLAAGDEALARLGRDREALTVALDHLADAESALAERRDQLEKARQGERLHLERDDARARFDRYAAAIVLRDELAELDRKHPSSMPLAELRPAVERLRSVDTRIATLEQLLAGEIQVDFDLPPERKWQPRSRMALALAGVGVLIAVISTALSVFGVLNLGPIPGIVGIIIALIGGVVAVAGLRERNADKVTVSRQMKSEEVNRRLRGRSDMEDELRLARAEREEVLAKLELPGTPEAEERLAAETAHVARIDQGRARLGGLIGDAHPDTLLTRRDTAAREIEQKTAALEALGPIAKEPRARERLEVEVRDAEGVVDRARDGEATARARVDQNTVDAEEVAGLAERLAGWRADLSTLRRRERILARTLAELDAAELATTQRATQFLERRMAGDIARITGGRYRQVRVEDDELAIQLLSPERGDWVRVTDLSRGTLDVVYLAARIGLARLVTGDRRPPLVLDDPLVTLDDDRATGALAMIREVSGDFQVIYLTTSDRYDVLADAVIILDGPTADAEAANP